MQKENSINNNAGSKSNSFEFIDHSDIGVDDDIGVDFETYMRREFAYWESECAQKKREGTAGIKKKKSKDKKKSKKDSKKNTKSSIKT